MKSVRFHHRMSILRLCIALVHQKACASTEIARQIFDLQFHTGGVQYIATCTAHISSLQPAGAKIRQKQAQDHQADWTHCCSPKKKRTLSRKNRAEVALEKPRTPTHRRHGTPRTSDIGALATQDAASGTEISFPETTFIDVWAALKEAGAYRQE